MNKLYEILKSDIKEYLNILREASTSAGAGWSAAHPDDGPAVYYGDIDDYHAKVKDMAEIVGYKILTHLIKQDPDYHYEYNANIVPVVSFGKSDKWKQHILKVGSQAGYTVLRGLSKKFGLESDSLEAGTPELYKQKSPGDTKATEEHMNEVITKNKLYSSYYHREVLGYEK